MKTEDNTDNSSNLPRTISDITVSYVNSLTSRRDIYILFKHKFNWPNKLWQYFEV